MKIRGVIHICQKGDWKRSFEILVKSLYLSGLLEATEKIDLCVVSDTEIDTSVFLPKSIYHFMGSSELYERPSLLCLRSLAEQDTEDVYYWYLHTKGLRWFGTERERNVLDWIQIMLYWNINLWEKAVSSLQYGYDTYGINLVDKIDGTEVVKHYSGNFWWSKSSYLKTLPYIIGEKYNDPEFWIMKMIPNTFSPYHSKVNHYNIPHPLELYSVDWVESIVSAWTGHRVFAEWLVWNTFPETIVELGVDYGYSTFVFANALKGTSGTIYGIDLFMGDVHTGYRNTYENVKKNITDHSVTNLELVVGDFDSISKLWKTPIDILHIDGLHTYEAVKNDFTKWSPFVKENGIILFHDIAVQSFGVKEFFRELTGGYKMFFLHSAGLGIFTRNKDLRDKIMNRFSNNVYDFETRGNLV
jgi:cephalosporin hydroxylase